MPDGRELTVEVPQGAAEELQLEFDPEVVEGLGFRV